MNQVRTGQIRYDKRLNFLYMPLRHMAYDTWEVLILTAGAAGTFEAMQLDSFNSKSIQKDELIDDAN